MPINPLNSKSHPLQFPNGPEAQKCKKWDFWKNRFFWSRGLKIRYSTPPHSYRQWPGLWYLGVYAGVCMAMFWNSASGRKGGGSVRFRRILQRVPPPKNHRVHAALDADQSVEFQIAPPTISEWSRSPKMQKIIFFWKNRFFWSRGLKIRYSRRPHSYRQWPGLWYPPRMSSHENHVTQQ